MSGFPVQPWQNLNSEIGSHPSCPEMPLRPLKIHGRQLKCGANLVFTNPKGVKVSMPFAPSSVLVPGQEPLVASLLLVAMPFAPSSFLFQCFSTGDHSLLRRHKVDEGIAQVGSKLHITWQVEKVVPRPGHPRTRICVICVWICLDIAEDGGVPPLQWWSTAEQTLIKLSQHPTSEETSSSNQGSY